MAVSSLTFLGYGIPQQISFPSGSYKISISSSIMILELEVQDLNIGDLNNYDCLGHVNMKEGTMANVFTKKKSFNRLSNARW